MEQSNYYAIMPANVRYDKMLSLNSKMLYLEISSLCNKEGYCWATNEYFSELFETSDRTIQRWLKELIDREYVTIELETFRYDDGKVKKKRKIFIVHHSDKFVIDHSDKNVTYNKDNKNNNKLLYSREELESIIKTIIDYLNSKCNKSYHYDTKSTINFIKARLKEGFTVEDFTKVIDTKCDEWLEDKYWSKFLRPETLFGTKFEGYLNQVSDSVSKKENHRRSF